MNVTELARRLKIPTKDLLERLPEMGYSVGKRAIKVNEKMAEEILQKWPVLNKIYEARLKAEAQAEEAARKARLGTAVVAKTVQIPPFLTVREFAERVEVPVPKVIQILMKNGIFASLNERIDFETAQIIGDDLEVKVIEDTTAEASANIAKEERVEEVLKKETAASLVTRAPVVVVMGHVDHGKTKLLDAIRSTNVVAGEAGGITQHIGAYQVEHKGKPITFIDTPGHEAFTAMRSRGARVADVAILVVAADDSVKTQTIEALHIIQQSQLPIIVAINKVDKPDANLDKVKSDLANNGLTPEEWGGQTVVVPVSALKKTGINELLDMIMLVADAHGQDIKANPAGQVVGTIVESHVDKGEGPVATMLVQNGTLRAGSYLAVDDTLYGRVRAMKNWNGQSVAAAIPSTPVKILGFKVAPKVGDIVLAVADQKDLKKKIAYQDLVREKVAASITTHRDEKEDEGIKKFPLIVKADMLGSLEAIIESLEKIHHPEIQIKIAAKGLGSINESDVLQAESSGGLIVGFQTKPTSSAELLARDKGVEIKLYKIIYDLLGDVRERMTTMLGDEVIRTDVGELEVLAIFKQKSDFTICGVRVKQGRVAQTLKATVLRKGVDLGTGEVKTVKIGKEVVNEVGGGNECGLEFVSRIPVEVGDIMRVFTEEIKAKTLA
ncbi:MAG: translation initiation factor IF-2 [Parcubacteria group bacterium]|nr:translation initiation factor IF-2 [Parcubacteria group bacterium]